MPVKKKLRPSFKIYSPEDLSKEWFIYYSESGKRRKIKGGLNRIHTYGERMAAALALVEELEDVYVPPSGVGEKMLDWIEEHRGRWRKKTYQTAKSNVDCFLEWTAGRPVDAALVRLFFRWLANERHGKTHNKDLQRFARIFKALGMPEVIQGIETIPAVSTPAKYFQRYQIERLKSHLLEADPGLWLACEFIYYCFIRPGELRLLKIGDIHFDEGKICIRSEVSKNKKQQYVIIPAAFRPSLVQLQRRSPDEYIFFTKDCTKPTSVNHLANKFREVLRTLRFGYAYKFYSWKHSGAVGCAKNGVNLEQLRIQLRHHSLDEVKGYLRQMGVEDLEDLSEKFPGI